MSSPVTPTTPAAPVDPTDLRHGNYTSSIILNRIFALILNMITSLQNATASQANNLTFMTHWQAAYTDAMSQVHTFIKNPGSGQLFSADSSSAASSRNDLNNLNSNFLQTLQNRQTTVSDNAKAIQSNINQSNDAVNQQSNLGTAILQELSTLLATIFK
ncbi:MAG TPA: hypothetical protein VGP47_08080 [Parachlamydiaceae bacterium]|nr:hypothetical protein [Parachlamydiaceae bacterium]